MVDCLSQERLKEYSSKIRRLLDETKYHLTIPNENLYDDKTLKKINGDWSQAVPKLMKAKNLIDEVLNAVCVDALCN
jgi:hypothetical protein